MYRFWQLKDLCVRPGTNTRYVVTLTAGLADSPEGKDQNMTQGYLVQFSSVDDRNYYVGRPFFKDYDPHHDAFKAFVGPLLDDVFVFDYIIDLNSEKNLPTSFSAKKNSLRGRDGKQIYSVQN